MFNYELIGLKLCCQLVTAGAKVRQNNEMRKKEKRKMKETRKKVNPLIR